VLPGDACAAVADLTDRVPVLVVQRGEELLDQR